MTATRRDDYPGICFITTKSDATGKSNCSYNAISMEHPEVLSCPEKLIQVGPDQWIIETNNPEYSGMNASQVMYAANRKFMPWYENYLSELEAKRNQNGKAK